MVMRKLGLAAGVLALLLLLPATVAVNPAGFMNSFVKAINTGNYSLIKPYMSDTLGEQFTEDYFNQIREFTLKNYGELMGYAPIGNETSGDLLKVEYRVKAEKGSFPVLLAYRNGTLVGIALGIAPRPNPLGMVASILSSIAATLLLVFRRRPSLSDFFLGSGLALGLAVIIPFYSIVLLTVGNPVRRALILALVSAATVEGLKFYFSRGRNGLSLGLGLGFGKYVLLAIGTFVSANFLMKIPVAFSGGALYVVLEAFLLTAYHGITGTIYSRNRRLIYPAGFSILLTAIYFSLAEGHPLGILLSLAAFLPVVKGWDHGAP
ncbi:DUF3887 domain-containing protein [Thermococcus sp.]